MATKPTNIYTDGACSNNQSGAGLGGWGAVLEYGAHHKEIWGGERGTTNNRREMMALIGAFENLTKDGLRIRVFSDSSYLMECFRKKWYVKWRNNGWLTAKKEPVENRDLWEKLLSFAERHDVSFYRVKGHLSLPEGVGGAQGPGDSRETRGPSLRPKGPGNRGGALRETRGQSLRPNPSGNAALQKAFAKFLEWNGASFTFDDFLHATEMNIRADELANRGIDSLRA
jgi:ribonuclease HI